MIRRSFDVFEFFAEYLQGISTKRFKEFNPGMNRTWNDVDENSVETFDFPAMMLSFLAMRWCLNLEKSFD